MTVNGTPNSATRWISGRKTVNVADGRLTVSNAPGASNNKVCFIDITTLSLSGGTTQGIASETPPKLTVSGPDESGEFTVQIDGPPGQRYRLEASEDLVSWKSLATLENDGGTVVFVDRDAAIESQCFPIRRL